MNNSDHLNFLIAAYSAIWVIISFFVFILIKRNRRLLNQVKELEDRLNDIEQGGSSKRH